MEKVSRIYKAESGVGCDGFQPKVPLDLTTKTIRKIVEFLEVVEQSGRWPQQACTATLFLIPKNITSERSIALMPTLIRWWEALRAPEVAKWQQKYSVDWDAADGRNGGAQQTVWEFCCGEAKEEDQGALALALDLAMTFERVRFPVVWAWATYFSFPRRILAISSNRGEFIEGCVSEPLQTTTSILPGSKWSCLLLRIVLQDALSEVTKIYPPLKLMVFEDDITALLMVKNREVAESAKKVIKRLREEVEKKASNYQSMRMERKERAR